MVKYSVPMAYFVTFWGDTLYVKPTNVADSQAPTL